MKTGEGKTLTATLPMVLNTLSGRACTSSPSTTTSPAATPSGWARSTASWASRSGSCRTCSPTRTSSGHTQRPITYGTNSEFGFDYLRDNMANVAREKVQNAGRFDEESGKPITGHAYAIVDEVDNILIDEARTPLIISGGPSRPPILRPLRQARAHDGAGQAPRGHGPAHEEGVRRGLDFEFDEKQKAV